MNMVIERNLRIAKAWLLIRGYQSPADRNFISDSLRHKIPLGITIPLQVADLSHLHRCFLQYTFDHASSLRLSLFKCSRFLGTRKND